MYKKSITADIVICIIMAIIIMLASTSTSSYDFKCPDRSHRKIRAKWLCNSTEENYSCMLDLQKNTFTESCSFTSDFVRPGQKYVISGRRKNTNCSNEQYQPFKFFSSELSKCAFAKSSCSEEGQIIFSEVSTIADRSCRCDYSEGYTFLSIPKHQCFCTPTEEDCSCYIATCPKATSLSSDYECKVDSLSTGICKPIVHTGQKHNIDTSADKTEFVQTLIGTEPRNFTAVNVILLNAVIIIVMFLWIVIERTATNDKSSNSTSSNMILSPEEHIDIVRQMYRSLEEILQRDEFDKDLQEELNEAYPDADYKQILKSAKRDLARNDCGIIITGETNAGKTTLINKILGLELLPTGNVVATKTVCRIRNSTEMMFKAYTKDEQLLKEKKFQRTKQMQSVIKEFIDSNHITTDLGDKLFYIDVYLPVPILEGNVIIVDTPGIGECTDLDDMLLDVLPQAVSFIFIINARNAGGIHYDRLLKIFGNIRNNIENMPCFEPREVFFLTNQWDIVNDNECENDGSVEPGSRTWNVILSKLKIGWPGVQDNSIYRISLKKTRTNGKHKYAKEFKRFKANLSKTILRNRNKRIEVYLSILNNFVRNAECGIASRLNILESEEEEQIQILQNHLERIKKLEEDNKQLKQYLENHKSQTLDNLTSSLFEYLHSPSNEKRILNPEGCKHIKKYKPDELENIVWSRLNDAIEKWFNNIQQTTTAEANEQIRLAVDVIKMIDIQLTDIEIDMTGVKPELTGKKRLEKRHWLPDSKTGLFFYLYVDTSNIFFTRPRTKKGRNEKASEIYNNIDRSKKKIHEMFEQSFGREYSKTILRICEGDIQNKINSMKRTNEQMTKQYLSLKSKQGSFLKLSKLMANLKAGIKKYEDSSV